LAKIHLWKKNVENDTFAMFRSLTELVEEREKGVELEISLLKPLVTDHLTKLNNEL